VIRGYADMRRSVVDHSPDGVQNTTNGSNLLSLHSLERRDSKEVPEQLVCAVDQMNVQSLQSIYKIVGTLKLV
jgi:hypothetical protein